MRDEIQKVKLALKTPAQMKEENGQTKKVVEFTDCVVGDCSESMGSAVSCSDMSSVYESHKMYNKLSEQKFNESDFKLKEQDLTSPLPGENLPNQKRSFELVNEKMIQKYSAARAEEGSGTPKKQGGKSLLGGNNNFGFSLSNAKVVKNHKAKAKKMQSCKNVIAKASTLIEEVDEDDCNLSDCDDKEETLDKAMKKLTMTQTSSVDSD